MRLRSTRLTAIANAIRDKFYGAALNMRFDNTTSLDPRITFSRTTNATLTNSSGLIANAPMNLLTFSEQFDNAVWTKTATTVTANNTVAPNGTTTADKLVENTSNAQHRVDITPVSPAVPQTFSVYAKAAERTFMGLRIGSIGAAFDLASGTFGSVGVGATASITDAGSGWYRCSVTVAAPTANDICRINLATSLSVAQSYTGDGTSGIFIWGAQLESNAAATTYNPTTVKNLLGFTENFDNAAWTKSNSFVQTNLAINSVFAGAVAGTPGTAPTSWPFVLSAGTTAVNGSSITFSVASAARHFIGQAFTLAANTTYTLSLNITEYSGVDGINVVLGSVSAGSVTAGSISITGSGDLGRRSTTFTTGGAGATISFRIGLGVNSNTPDASSVTFDSVQLVQGTSAGDYKATYAAAAAVGYTDIYGQPFAQKLVENTATAQHYIQQSDTSAAADTLSVYAKAGERNWLFLGAVTGSAFYDLTSGQLGTVSAGHSASIESVGNGWYRCAITQNSATTGALRIYVAQDNNVSNYTGDGTSGIYIFGAQLSDSASVDPYAYQPVAAPTSTAYYGPRFDYDPVTLAPKGLLIEEQRTNLALYSEIFSDAVWSKSETTLSANTAIAPDGNTTADTLTETSATAVHTSSQTITVAAVSNTFSVYLKKGSGATAPNWMQLSFGGASTGWANFNLLTGTVGTVSSGTASITSAGNGWYRCALTTTTTAGSASIQIVFTNNADGVRRPSYAGAVTSDVFVWGAQLEAGAFPTSYVATSASQVTRAADSASMIGNNFARWYNQTTGTVFAQYSVNGLNPGASNAAYGITDNTTSNFIAGRTLSSAATNFQVRTGGADQVALNSVTVAAGVVAKSAGSYALNNFAFTTNAGAVQTDTAGALPVVTQMQIGGLTSSVNPLNGTISRISYYNRRLANTELQAVTS